MLTVVAKAIVKEEKIEEFKKYADEIIKEENEDEYNRIKGFFPLGAAGRPPFFYGQEAADRGKGTAGLPRQDLRKVYAS